MRVARHQHTPLASERIERVLFLSLGFGGLVFSALAVSVATTQFAVQSPLEGAPLLIVLTAISAMFLALSSLLPMRTLRLLATIYIAVFTLALACWLPLQTAETLPNHDSPWLLLIITLATSAAAIAWPQRWTWTYIITVCVAGGLLRLLADRELAPIHATEEFFYMLLISTIFAALIQVTRRAGEQQDAVTAAAYAEAMLAGATRARTEQRARFGALVHDDVISTLLVASRGEEVDRESTREYARRALTRISAVREPDAHDEDVPPSECAARLRAASDLPGAPVLAVAIKSALPVPSSAITSLGEALGEALRNSLRHAGPPGEPVTRTASAIIDADGIRIEVGDDGVGFLPQRVPPERLGLRVSVVGRMTAVAGGSATVTSRPHEGTRVELGWSRSKVAADVR